MSLRERMHRSRTDRRSYDHYERYGVIDNPFPSAGQSSRHPRMTDAIDDEIQRRTRRFKQGKRTSEVIVVEVTQGVGKTNLLKHYERQSQDEALYIVRYCPDPEPSLDYALRTIFQHLDRSHLKTIGRKQSIMTNAR